MKETVKAHTTHVNSMAFQRCECLLVLFSYGKRWVNQDISGILNFKLCKQGRTASHSIQDVLADFLQKRGELGLEKEFQREKDCKFKAEM